MPHSILNEARDIMLALYPDQPGLASAYVTITEFLVENPDMASGTGSGAIDANYLRKYANRFASGRSSHGPTKPKTVPDERIRDILHTAFAVPTKKLDKAILYHLEAMGAESFIGWVLESYIAASAEPLGWIWCSGALIRSVDFIRRTDKGWRMLQIKNRSNSENSSSSRVRLGTSIEKWFRIFANSGLTNWEAFPDPELSQMLSEDGFRNYILGWLRKNFKRGK